MTLALVGPGAIGCVVAAALAEAGHDVVVCARTPFEAIVLRSADAKIARVRVRVVTDPSEVREVAWTLLCTKAHQTAGAAPWLRSATRVAVLQNGVEHEANVAPFLPPGAVVVPVVVRYSARRSAPGVVTTGRPGSLTVPDTEAGRAFAALFAGSGVAVAVTPDFVTEAWSKLCLNAVNGALLTLTDRKLEVLREPRIAAVARELVRECVAVGRAEGAKLDDSLADTLVAELAAHPDAATRGNSMTEDRAAGRPLEWDARNGVVVRKGALHGIPTPVSATLTALLAALLQSDR